MVQPHLWLTVFFLLLSFMTANADDRENIGNFDIDKVREAVHSTDTGLAETETPLPGNESITLLVLRITLYLGLIIALIVFVAWVFRNRGLQVAIRGSGGGAMDVIETLPVGQNRMILMLRVMDEIYLLSQTATAITLLDKIGGDKAVEIISSSKGGGTIMPFKEAFNTFMGKIKKSS